MSTNKNPSNNLEDTVGYIESTYGLSSEKVNQSIAKVLKKVYSLLGLEIVRYLNDDNNQSFSSNRGYNRIEDRTKHLQEQEQKFRKEITAVFEYLEQKNRDKESKN